eukprot:8052241-Prorocentrum_lima.AAC.1
MLSAYKHNLKLCQEEGNDGLQFPQTEIGTLQSVNAFQSDELNAQPGTMSGLPGHMDQHVGRL